MRRLTASLLVLAPLAAALVYAGAHALLGPQPTTANAVPGAAVCCLRFRGLEALDRHWPFDRPERGRVSEVLGALRNVPGLKGVDRSGPVHWVLLPRGARSDPTLMIFPLSDPAAFRERFEGRDLPEAEARGLERHAQHLEIRGSFAALAWDREAVRHLGEGGVTCEDRGEDFACAIDVPAMAAYVLSDAGRAPWRAVAEALGAEPSKVEGRLDPATGRRNLSYPWGRVPTVGDGWKTARLWAFAQRKTVEVELETRDAALLRLLAEVTQASGDAPDVSAPAESLAMLDVPTAAAGRALGRALHLAGVKGAELLASAPPPAPPDSGRRLVFALPNASEGHGWTLALWSPCGPLVDLAEALDLPAPGASRSLAAGAAPITVSDGRWDGLSAAGSVARVAAPSGAGPLPCPGGAGGAEVVLLGADAARYGTSLDALRWAPAALPSVSRARLVARFWLRQDRARELLAGALTEGGLFSVLAGGDLTGELTTDGRVLRLRLHAASSK